METCRNRSEIAPTLKLSNNVLVKWVCPATQHTKVNHREAGCRFPFGKRRACEIGASESSDCENSRFLLCPVVDERERDGGRERDRCLPVELLRELRPLDLLLRELEVGLLLLRELEVGLLRELEVGLLRELEVGLLRRLGVLWRPLEVLVVGDAEPLPLGRLLEVDAVLEMVGELDAVVPLDPLDPLDGRLDGLARARCS